MKAAIFPYAPILKTTTTSFVIHRISLLSFILLSNNNKKRSMMTCSSSSNRAPGEFTTLKEEYRCDKEIKKSKFIAIAAPLFDESSAQSFLSRVKESRATHNCWAYKVGDQYRSNDDGEPSGTAGKPIYSAIESSGLDRVMVVVIRYFGGIKLGTGGLVRAYGGVASECLKNAPTCLVKSKVTFQWVWRLRMTFWGFCIISCNIFKSRT
ncbi:uncharacterized protein LOC141721429 isoform X2 [Apium graveolens]|uniref:uncharacterized protein LOC141721429 isoform X2 n=1 Tax=Apium graveolens TaxID=4045 RepID=UPI003D7ACE58